ncbi:MAG: hypothetical protein ACI9H8_002400 [Lysobacterales bacterium]|jgi:hypothetical protein
MNKFKMLLGLRVIVAVLLVWGSSTAIAQLLVMTIANDDSAINHYPGPDGLIGNGDDVVSNALTTVQMSAPNANGSFGHNAFVFSAVRKNCNATTVIRMPMTNNNHLKWARSQEHGFSIL